MVEKLRFAQYVFVDLGRDDPEQHDLKVPVWQVGTKFEHVVLPLLKDIAEVIDTVASRELVQPLSAGHLDKEIATLEFSEQAAPELHAIEFVILNHAHTPFVHCVRGESR